MTQVRWPGSGSAFQTAGTDAPVLWDGAFQTSGSGLQGVDWPGSGGAFGLIPAGAEESFLPTWAPGNGGGFQTDGNPLELAIWFRLQNFSSTGKVHAVRVYIGNTDLITFRVRLYHYREGSYSGAPGTSAGTLLAEAAPPAPTTSGWQRCDFATPVAIGGDTGQSSYVASFYSDNGRFTNYHHYFDARGPGASGITTTILLAYHDGDAPQNAYRYGTLDVNPAPNTFLPDGTFNATAYGVDVVY